MKDAEKIGFLFYRLFFVILWLSLCPAAMATNVGGDISIDTIWDSAGSPYILISDVNILSTTTLQIDPGVEVRTGNYTISVSGHLAAYGATFTSTNVAAEIDVSADGKLLAGVGEGDEVVARAISVSSGTLKFRLLI